MTLKDLCARAHTQAKEKGWWDGERSIPECLALIHSEVSEALEEYRKDILPEYQETGYVGLPLNTPETSWSPFLKPEGIAVELADVVIRIADLCASKDWDLQGAVQRKLAYNDTRPYRHGGKKA